MSNRKQEMTAKEARTIISEVYGHRAQGKAATDIRRGEVTVSRWITGHTPIDSMSALMLRMVYVLHQHTVPWRKWISDYEIENGIAEENRLGADDLI